jgi:hypothetical protein
MHHGQKHRESARGGYVLGLTTGKITGKLPLVAHIYQTSIKSVDFTSVK